MSYIVIGAGTLASEFPSSADERLLSLNSRISEASVLSASIC